MKHFYSVVLGLFLITQFSIVNAQTYTTNVADSLAMYDLYNSTIENGSWSDTWGNSDVAISNWDGVVTDTIDNTIYVTEISLEGCNKDYVYPSGTIPSSIGDLSHLTILKLIGEESGDDTNLTYPHRINLHGSIPSEIWNLTSLERLQIKFTNLTGGLPAISDPSSLTALYEVNFQQTYLGGEIPESLFELPALTKPYLHESGFTGEVPSTLASQTSLERLYFQGNELSGDLPYSDDMFDNSNAKVKLTGNYFSPASMANYADATFKSYTNDYQFAQDTVVINIGEGESVTLTDTLSDAGDYSWFKDQDPMDASVSASVIAYDASTYAISSFTSTDAGTYYCECYPTACNTLPYYSVFVVKDAGTGIHADPTDSLALVDFYNATTEEGDWSDTWLQEPISNWDGVVTDTIDNTIYVTEISLEGCNKDYVYPSGTIPSSIGDLSHLTILKLIGEESGDDTNLTYPHRINLHGSIPSEVWNLTSLERLQIKFTNLTGGLPAISDPSSLTALYEVNFQQTYLGGEIPESLFELPALTKPYLHESGFTGEVPSTLASQTSLERLYFQGNELSGDLPYSDDMFDNSNAKVKLTGNYFSPASMANYAAASFKSYTNDYQFAQDTIIYTLSEGDSQTLTDTLSDAGDYSWFKDQDPMDASVSATVISEGSATYSISSFSSSDAGTYYCECYPSAVELPYYAVFIIKDSGETTGINKVEESTYTVAPNPFDTYINVNTESDIKTVAIYNLVGKMVYKANYEGATSATIETGDYTKGLYIVKITTNDQIITKKMIKR